MGQEFPARVWRESKKDYCALGRQGKLLHWTEVRTAPEGHEELTPYVVALIRLARDEVISGQLVDWERRGLRKGLELVGVPRRIRVEGREGLIRYGVKWRVK